ncbi:hypothetical protein EZ449_07335 [Pedobacter frigidisoli]|uniref:Uncharacterized protein n=1 Tax=Pedobacter frigidisoli TaxID=2530455 RepID=A0A4R0P5P4_9SPHI|nr:DUF6717 family protein [Pedobacter frigidisoli]TCD10696.1 hypothetical protein EZ449_07335 [Pedobacter frigidisoli]
MERAIRFYKNAKQDWYADIPEWGGDIADLQMVEGADELLNWVAASGDECKLLMADKHFESSEILELVYTREENLGGGGDYMLESFRGEIKNHRVWLCGVTEYVFKQLPQRIYFKDLYNL